jgi:hypothetical protein
MCCAVGLFCWTDGLCSFRAALNAANVLNVTEPEMALLTKAFAVRNDKGVVERLDYAKFCDELETVFTEKGLHLRPLAELKSFSAVNEGYENVSQRGQGLLPQSRDDLISRTDPLLTEMRDIVYTRRIDPKQFFLQHDRHKTGYVRHSLHDSCTRPVLIADLFRPFRTCKCANVCTCEHVNM